MQRGIVDADDGDFTSVCLNKGGLIDQEGDLVAIGEFGVAIDRHAAVIFMVAQGDEDQRDLAQAYEKAKHVGQPLWHIQQVAGDEDPVWAEFADGCDDAIVARLIVAEMEIAQMDGPFAAKGLCA